MRRIYMLSSRKRSKTNFIAKNEMSKVMHLTHIFSLHLFLSIFEKQNVSHLLNISFETYIAYVIQTTFG